MDEVSGNLKFSASSTDIYFQPGIALFIGEVGSAIYDQFCSPPERATENLLTYIPVALRRGIGLIWPGSIPAVYSARLAAASETMEDKPLADTITALLDEIAWSFNEAGYIVDNTHPHIYVIGHIQAPGILDTVKIVRDCWRQKYRNTSVGISYLYCCYPLSAEQTERAEAKPAPPGQWKEDIVAWTTQEKINSCYLYGDDHVVTNEERQTINHAVATALFTLLVTALPCRSQYKLLLQQHGNTRYTLGTLNACLVSSSIRTILSACRAHCTVLLLDKWLQKSEKIRDLLIANVQQRNKRATEDQQRATQEDRINSSIRVVLDWMQPMRNPASASFVVRMLPHWLYSYLKRFFPSLPVAQHFQSGFSCPAFLSEDEYFSRQNALMRCNAELFRWRTLATVFPSRRWLALMEQRFNQIKQEMYPLWQRAASQLWELARTRVVEQLGNELEGLKDLSDYDKIDPQTGPFWLIACADILDSRLAVQQDSADVLSDLPVAQGEELESAEYRHLCANFDDALKKLPRLRDIVKLMVLALIAIPVLSLLLINFLAALFGGQTWLTTLFFPLFAGVILAGNIFYLLALLHRHLPTVAQAQNALLGYYWRLHRSFCEREEYRLRMETIGVMRKRIEGLCSAVLTEVKTRFEKEASDTFQRWFQDIAARHCILVGNGKFFQQNAQEAIYTFLKARPGDLSSAPKKPAETIFQSLSSKDAPFQSLSSQCFYENGLHREANSAVSHTEILYNSLSNLMQSMIGSPQISRYLKINNPMSNRELWKEIFRRITSGQREQEKLTTCFLCGSKAILGEHIDKQEVVEPSSSEIFTLYTGESNDNVSYNPQVYWFLVAALSLNSEIEAPHDGISLSEDEE